MTKSDSLKKLTVSSLLTALAYLCVFLLRFKVSFLTFDLKDAVLSVTAFIYGPLTAVCSAVAVAFLELITVSDTGLYGFLMNAISSSAFVFCCGIVYKYRRTFSGAILGVVAAAVGTTCVMLVFNLFVTPFYMGVTLSEVAALIPSLLLPFNLVKGIINASVTMIIYKPITGIFKRVGLSSAADKKLDLKKLALSTAVTLVIIMLSTLFIIYFLKGDLAFL